MNSYKLKTVINDTFTLYIIDFINVKAPDKMI